jgi:hypothetical protein
MILLISVVYIVIYVFASNFINLGFLSLPLANLDKSLSILLVFLRNCLYFTL